MVRAFCLDDGGDIWKTADAGANWSAPLRGNLDDYGVDHLQTIELFTPTSAAGDDILLVGGVGGVYRTRDPNSAGGPYWTRFGRELPNAIVSDLHYYGGDDILVAATIGRGVWTVSEAAAELQSIATLEIIGDTDFRGQDDQIALQRNDHNPLMLDAHLNDDQVSVPLASLEAALVLGRWGDDRLTVDFSQGEFPSPPVFYFNGGGNEDTLRFVGAGEDDVFQLNNRRLEVDGQAMTFSRVEAVDLRGGSGEDEFFVTRTSSGTSLALRGGSANDVFHIGSINSSLDAIRGPVRVLGGSGDNNLYLDDRASRLDLNLSRGRRGRGHPGRGESVARRFCHTGHRLGRRRSAQTG